MPNDCVAVKCTPKSRREYECRTGETISFHRFVEMFTVKWQHVYQVLKLNIMEIVMQTRSKAAKHEQN